MPLSEMAFKEALRLKPPVPSMPRRAVRDFSFKGFAMPAGTLVGVNPLFTHHMPEIWPEPGRFDPMRFTGGTAQPPPLRLGAVRRRRAYVPRAAFCLHAGQMLRPAFVAESQRIDRARLPGTVADVADPEAARRAEGDGEAGVSARTLGWAKAPLRRAHHQHSAGNGGHADALRTLRTIHRSGRTPCAARHSLAAAGSSCVLP
jgi:hypothetical protein